jgi:fructose-1,6-bisphosphatase/sedoheptulose 1,7-bisphosphatase-like protein
MARRTWLARALRVVVERREVGARTTLIPEGDVAGSR